MGSMLVTILYYICIWWKGKVRGTFEIYIMHIIRLEIVESRGYNQTGGLVYGYDILGYAKMVGYV